MSQAGTPRDAPAGIAEPPVESRRARLAAGKALREAVPRESHAAWERPLAEERDPVAILERSNVGRLPDLVPIRYGRMLRSPFTFLRGSAGLMAHDLARMPGTGIRVQTCGDCHLLNFGFFATPERSLIFDINDFDETLPAPWEWDVKRLAMSLVVAARDLHLSDAEGRDVARECLRAYRDRLRDYSRMSPLDIWYARIDVDTLIAMAPDEKSKRRREDMAKAARKRVVENLFPKIASHEAGRHRLVDQPPLIYHVAAEGLEERVRAVLASYRESLPDERRVLLDHYRIEDFAIKVVGIGSVGTRCWILLLFSEEDHPLLLQVKEAGPSVLEPWAGQSRYPNQGQRVVIGQRLMQASSDIFLGWAEGPLGRNFYVRQLRDMKFSIPLQGVDAAQLERYGAVCGWALARAHARSGDAARISGYIGKSDAFVDAVAELAVAYADQTEHDHAAFREAADAGRIEALDDADA